ncbi:RNA recognition motif. (a.k.a. RRM, RBD, or RNP domain)/RNA recognition motif (a.k.a. RRM, RBD, or RNP domain), putative [Entamoeba histolytica]
MSQSGIHYNINDKNDRNKITEELNKLEQFQYGEHPSRVLCVFNILSQYDPKELLCIFQQYGDVKTIYYSTVQFGFIVVIFYDIRSSRSAAKYLNGRCYRGHQLHIVFGIPIDINEGPNHGTLVIFNIDKQTDDETLKTIFSKYGEIKEIRETPSRKYHKFIEYFDSRSSDVALKELNDIEINGRKIKIEISKPNISKLIFLQCVSNLLGIPREVPVIIPPSELIDLIQHYAQDTVKHYNEHQNEEQLEQIEFDSEGNVLDKVKNTVIIKNISRRCSHNTFIRYLQNSISSFYKNAFLFRETNSQTGVVIVTNPSVIVSLFSCFNDKMIEPNQEQLCQVYYSRYQDKDFIEKVEEMIR